MSDFERDFKVISNTIVSAYQNWEIWWFYKHEGPRYKRVINSYLSFFNRSTSAHFLAMLMSVCRLVDDKSVSLKSLLIKLKKEKQLGQNEITKIDQSFAELAGSIRGAQIIRNNIFAHTSKKIDSDQAFRKANLKHDDFKDLIIELGNIFNLLRTSCGEPTLAFWVNSSKNDTERLLTDLGKVYTK